MVDKIKVNLDPKSKQILLDDMVAFSIVKKDGSINKNAFLNILLRNYYTNYSENLNNLFDETFKIFSSYLKNEKNAKELATIYLNFYCNDYINNKNILYNDSISFNLVNDNQTLFSIIEEEQLSNQSLSSFLRNMIGNYLSLPQYKREIIIYKDIVDKISESININKKIRIQLTNGEIYVVSPFRLSTTKEELYFYLICLKNSHVFSFNISRIKSVYILKEIAEFTKDELLILESNIASGIQFAFDEPCNAVISLTPKGKRLFERRYLHRPVPIKIENNRYYFSCAYSQLLFYFFAFGEDAMVLEPATLKNTFLYKYKKAYKLYSDNIVKQEKNISLQKIN